MATGKCYSPRVDWNPEVKHYFEGAFGVEGFRQLEQTLCQPPVSTCIRVNTLRTTVQDVLAQIRARQPDVQAVPHPLVPEAIMITGSGPHAVDYSQCTKEVVISRKAGEAVLRGAHVYVPGVLAASPGISAGDLVAVSIALEPPGKSNCGITRGLVLSSEPGSNPGLASREGLYIGIGQAMMPRSEIFRVSRGVAVQMEQRPFMVPSWNGQMEGDIMLQNLASVVAAHVLCPTPGSRVLDMCAAPGGKTTMMAQLMGDTGEIVAFDRSHAKAQDVLSLASELGFTCIKAYKMDATKAVQQEGSTQAQQQQQQQQQQPAAQSGPGAVEQLQQGQQQPQEQQQQQQQQQAQAQQQQARHHSDPPQAGPAMRSSSPQPPSAPAAKLKLNPKELKRQQRVIKALTQRGLPLPASLLDPSAARAPTLTSPFPPNSFDFVLCDAPCTALGQRPRLTQPADLALLRQTAAYQRKILTAAVQLVRPGGHLLFSTCTINPMENEGNVRWLLDSYPCLQLVQQEPRLGGPGLTGCWQPAEEDGRVAHSGEAGVLGDVWLTAEEAGLVQRFDPCSRQESTIGFFIAKFVKLGG